MNTAESVSTVKAGPLRRCRLLPLCLCLLLGCEPARRPEPPLQSSPYYPLQVGNEWVYRHPEHRRALRVARHEKLGNQPCALLQTFLDDELIEEQHVFATDQGLFALSTGGQKLTRPLPLLVLPPTEGRTWTFDMKIMGLTTRHVHLLARETVTVPAGTYDCVAVHGEVFNGNRREMVLGLWFARDVGIVKQLKRVGEQDVVYELESFTPGPSEISVLPERRD